MGFAEVSLLSGSEAFEAVAEGTGEGGAAGAGGAWIESGENARVSAGVRAETCATVEANAGREVTGFPAAASFSRIMGIGLPVWACAGASSHAEGDALSSRAGLC